MRILSPSCGQIMKPDEIRQQIEREIDEAKALDNMHGITLNNVREFLVNPYKEIVFGEDPNEPPKEMWVVLHETSDPSKRYRIGLDLGSGEWCLIESDSHGRAYSDTLGGNSFIEALNGM